MGKQEALDGIMTEHPAIEKAAGAYVAARDARMALTKDEVATRAALIEAMKSAGVLSYRTTDGLECSLTTTTTEKIKVRAPKSDEDDPGDEAEDAGE